jgi:putative membrane protein
MPSQFINILHRVFRFPVLGRLWKYVVAVAIYAALVTVFGRILIAPDPHPQGQGGDVILGGILFGWLMSFRTQTAYSRWWEGRSLWGQLVNESRNLVLKATAYVPEPDARQLGSVVVRFAESLRDHLRLPGKVEGPHRPMAAAGEVVRLIRAWHAEGKIDGYAFLALDQHAQQLMNVCGACEKIRATPLAASYRGLLRKGITAYLLLLPWLMMDDFGWETVPVAAMVAYAIVGLELIATNIEDPFGFDGDDLPIDDIVETIRAATAA